MQQLQSSTIRRLEETLGVQISTNNLASYAVLGLDPSRPAFFVQWLSVSGLAQFIDAWAAAGKKNWNPKYSPRRREPNRLYDFARRNSTEEIVREFNVSHDPFYVTLPFDGWTLANLARISYQHLN